MRVRPNQRIKLTGWNDDEFNAHPPTFKVNSGGQAHENNSFISTLVAEHAGEILRRSTSRRQLMREALGRKKTT